MFILIFDCLGSFNHLWNAYLDQQYSQGVQLDWENRRISDRVGFDKF